VIPLAGPAAVHDRAGGVETILMEGFENDPRSVRVSPVVGLVQHAQRRGDQVPGL
jgi:hypothetical protein